MTALLTTDRLKNWDAIAYPHWVLGVPTYFFYFTVLAGLISIVLAAKSIYDHA